MTYKAVIIGYGGMGRSWERDIINHPDWEVSGIIDVDTEMLENFSDKFDENVFPSIETCVQLSHKPDLAIIATPIYTHNSLTREVMDLGINVMCEKNMASTIYQARQMVQKAIDNPNILTGVGTQYRYGTGPWTARKFFEQNLNDDAELSIGKLGMINWQSNDYRGETRWGWRRFLQEVYLEDMSVHWFDTIRYMTGLEVTQIKADLFMPQYSDWHGSSEIYAQFALAHPDDFNHRHNWVWVQLYGGWQKRGPTGNNFIIYGGKGQANVDSPWGVELKLYTDKNNSTKFEEDGFIPADAGPIEGYEKYQGHGTMLEMYKKGIEDNCKTQCGTHFREAIKSFSIAMAAMDASRSGNTIWVPDYYKDLDLEF